MRTDLHPPTEGLTMTDPTCILAATFPDHHVCSNAERTPITEGERCHVNARLEVTADTLAAAIMEDPFVGPRGFVCAPH